MLTQAKVCEELVGLFLMRVEAFRVKVLVSSEVTPSPFRNFYCKKKLTIPVYGPE
jgi:hypothetical protein